MNILIELETLEMLYQNGKLSAEGLAAIAPIDWLSRHYPELINTKEKVVEAILSTAQKTCNTCIHFSSIHHCCMTRIEADNSYVAVTHLSPACKDLQEVSLPHFIDEK